MIPLLENILASRIKIKILRFFYEYPHVKRTVREMIKDCFVGGYGPGSKALKELQKTGILKLERNKRERIYSLNNDSQLFIPIKNI